MLKIAATEFENYYAGLPEEDRKFPMKIEGVPARLAKVMLVYAQLQGFTRPILSIPNPQVPRGAFESQETAEKNFVKEVDATLTKEREFIYEDRSIAPLAASANTAKGIKEEAHVTEEEVKQSSIRPR